MSPEKVIQTDTAVLRELGDAQLAKCDLFLAKKLYLQADISDPALSESYAGYERACALEKTLDAEVPATSGSGHARDETFDFLVVHSGRCATTATQNYLSLHPELLVSQKWEIDVALEKSEEDLLLRRYLARKHRAGNNIKMGIVQHSYMAGVRGDPEIARRLAAIADTERFFHLVRDPGDLIVSFYNHILVSRFAGGYTFPGSPHFAENSLLQSTGDGLVWPPQWPVSRHAPMTGWRQHKSDRDGPSFACDMTRDAIGEACREALSVTCYDTIGRNYGKYFGEWVVVDSDDLSPPSVKQEMRRIFTEIGVDPSFYHPAFDAPGTTRARRAMVNNYIELTGLPTPLFANLDFAHQSLYSYSWPLIEAATVAADDRCRAAGLGSRPLSLSVNMYQWAMLPHETRRWLVEDGKLRTFLVDVMLPAWLDVYEAWTGAMTSHLASGLEDLDAKGILTRGVALENLRRELVEFLKHHPQFAGKWPIASEILGAD